MRILVFVTLAALFSAGLAIPLPFDIMQMGFQGSGGSMQRIGSILTGAGRDLMTEMRTALGSACGLCETFVATSQRYVSESANETVSEVAGICNYLPAQELRGDCSQLVSFVANQGIQVFTGANPAKLCSIAKLCGRSQAQQPSLPSAPQTPQLNPLNPWLNGGMNPWSNPNLGQGTNQGVNPLNPGMGTNQGINPMNPGMGQGTNQGINPMGPGMSQGSNQGMNPPNPGIGRGTSQGVNPMSPGMGQGNTQGANPWTNLYNTAWNAFGLPGQGQQQSFQPNYGRRSRRSIRNAFPRFRSEISGVFSKVKGEMCSTCVEMMGQMRQDILGDVSTTQVSALLNKACKLMPCLNGTSCADIAAQFPQALKNYASEMLDVRQMCTNLRACESDSGVSGGMGATGDPTLADVPETNPETAGTQTPRVPQGTQRPREPFMPQVPQWPQMPQYGPNQYYPYQVPPNMNPFYPYNQNPQMPQLPQVPQVAQTPQTPTTPPRPMAPQVPDRPQMPQFPRWPHHEPWINIPAILNSVFGRLGIRIPGLGGGRRQHHQHRPRPQQPQSPVPQRPQQPQRPQRPQRPQQPQQPQQPQRPQQPQQPQLPQIPQQQLPQQNPAMPNMGNQGFPYMGMGGYPNMGMGRYPNMGMGGYPNTGMGGYPNTGMGGYPNTGMMGRYPTGRRKREVSSGQPLNVLEPSQQSVDQGPLGQCLDAAASNGTIRCELCKKGITGMSTLINNQMQQHSDTMAQACDMLPAGRIRAKCLSIINPSLPTNSNPLAAVDPLVACQQLSICPGGAAAAANMP